MECIICGDSHDKKGMYCSKRCTDKAYRDRKKLKEQGDYKPEEKPIIFKKSASLPKEVGPKYKWCNYCGTSIVGTNRLQFCCDEHHRAFLEAVKQGKNLQIRLDDKTLIITKHYDRVQEIIEKRQETNYFFKIYH